MRVNAISPNQQYTFGKQRTKNITKKEPVGIRQKSKQTNFWKNIGLFSTLAFIGLTQPAIAEAGKNIQPPKGIYSTSGTVHNDSTYEATKEYKLFDNNVEISIDYIRDKDLKLPYVYIGPKEQDENTEYPLMVFLHGGAQHGKDEESMYEIHTPAGFINNLGLDTFNGYIICPHLSDEYKDWRTKDAAEAVQEIIDKFKSEHNTGKTVLVGASMGAGGASYIARKLGPEYFDEVVYISGCDGNAEDVKMTFLAYAAENENYQLYKDYFGWNLKIINNATHETIVKELFSQDKDKNNCSDFLKKLFGEDK